MGRVERAGCGPTSHPSANYAYGWGTRSFEAGQEDELRVGHPPDISEGRCGSPVFVDLDQIWATRHFQVDVWPGSHNTVGTQNNLSPVGPVKL